MNDYIREFFRWLFSLIVSSKSNAEIEELQIQISDLKREIDALNKRIERLKRKVVMLELMSTRPASPAVTNNEAARSH